MNPHRTWEFAVRAGTVLAAMGAGTALVNRITLRQLRDGDAEVTEPVTVCVPARDEADRLPELIADLRAQQGVPLLRVLILDDDSSDDTYRVALDAIGGDERFTLLRNNIPPVPGWTGKNAACARLTAHADDLDGAADLIDPGPDRGGYTPRRVESGHGSIDSGVLIFLDADVRLSPGALAAGVHELRRTGASLVCPWPAQRAEAVTERLVQPLLAWSWASTLPVALGNALPFPSMAVACGQFLVFDAAAYRSIGGHTSVADRITEDLAIARELRRNGHRTALVAGGDIASTRMYRGARELDAGYRRWLWTAYGGGAGSGAVGGYAALAYWLPPLAAMVGRGRMRWIGSLGYTAAVLGRLAARSLEHGGPLRPKPLGRGSCGSRPEACWNDGAVTPEPESAAAQTIRSDRERARTRRSRAGVTGADVLSAVAHPISVAAYLALSIRSHRARWHGTLVWKGRVLGDNR